jgi:uncharacterized hydrophobic protein (TIGR00271 family)
MADVLHLRLITPSARTDEALAVLDERHGVTNVAVVRGAAREPKGDLIFCDVAREAANEVIHGLKWLEEAGSIAIEHVDVSLSRVAEHAKSEAPGEGDDAVVWADLARKVHNDSQMTWAFLAFLAIATQLAGIGVLLDSPILIVGAMVLGPEFGAVAAICLGLLDRDGRLIVGSLRTLAVGFSFAIAVTFVCAWVSAHAFGWVDSGWLAVNEEVKFIVKPDRWSFIVALLAGAAGVLSITADKSSALVGVFISVTVVPAAGYAAVALALGDWPELAGSAAQLAVNLAGMIVSGTATLFIQRSLWPQIGQLAGRNRKSSV